jgi:hypothetical protein
MGAVQRLLRVLYCYPFDERRETSTFYCKDFPCPLFFLSNAPGGAVRLMRERYLKGGKNGIQNEASS